MEATKVSSTTLNKTKEVVRCQGCHRPMTNLWGDLRKKLTLIKPDKTTTVLLVCSACYDSLLPS